MRRTRSSVLSSMFFSILFSAVLVVVVVVVLLGGGALPRSSTFVTAQSQTPSMPAPAGVEIAALDKRADPCIDFYQFACGGWMARNPLPADRRSFGRFAELQERNFEILRRVLENPGANASADARKASDFYAACMNEDIIERKALTPVEADLAMLDALRNPDDLPVLVAHLHDVGVPAFFRFAAETDLSDATRATANVDQSGLALPDRDLYLKDDERSRGIRTKYAAHVENILTLAGLSPEDAAGGARATIAIETALARASMDRVARREPSARQHRMTLVALQSLTPAFDWKKYAAAVEAPKFQVLNVSVPDYFRALNALLESTPLDDLKSYLRWQLLNASADALPKAFADAHFDFFSRTLAGQQAPDPRWRRCVTETDRRLGEALGKAFVEQTFSARAKSDTLKMVEDIKGAMRMDIDGVPWMSGETKKAAMTKLDAVIDRIGYPDTWRDYSGVSVSPDDALGNLQRTVSFERQRNLQKIGQAVDRNEWSMTPPTVNAYYSPDRNNINFPAGILQPPFYRAGRDAAVNYGAAGAVIGHELTHAFDDQGRKFDPQGNLRDWWTAADARAFEERASCVADQYSGYTVAGDAHVNGRLTLGENTADNGGLRLALTAYLNGPGGKPGGPGNPGSKDKIDGFTPDQRVFLGWAQVWCENARPEAERLKAQTNPHASNKYRVNGPVSNMPEFAKAFQCKANAPMVRPNPCRVW
ncbi:MAG TPA: M13 family metallopeptidase [Vicinamibacterales bacterium]|nr:M13 family metallopeptidase [Vicinamibacterales bacterium]